MRDALHRVRELPALKYQRSDSANGGFIDKLKELSEASAATKAAVGVLLNSATQINSLPPELLGYIFFAYATDEVRHGPAYFRPFKIPSARASILLTEVCKHWRDVALSTPSLWSGIVCGGKDRTPYNRYIRLSRSNPLRVKVNGDAETTAELFRDQPSRIRHLLMLDINENWTRRREPRDLLAVVAPDLLSCTLELRYWPRGAIPEHSFPLFNDQAPDLRELVIHNARIVPLDSFPNLTHLMLYDIQGTPSLPHLLQLLHRCPKLQEVCLRSVREIAQLPATSEQQQIVTLPHLRRISLLIQSSCWLLSYIEIPSMCLVRLDNVTLNELSKLPQLPICHQLSADRLTRLGVFSGSASPIIQGRTTEFNIELSDPDTKCGLFLSIAAPLSTSRTALGAAATDAFTGNPLFGNVAVLWAVRHPTSFVLSLPVLRALPSLTMLGILFHERTRIADLAVTLSAKEDGSVICPQLSALCVENCKDTEQFESIRQIVQSRAQPGRSLRLRRLAIGCAEPLRAHALALQEHVDGLIVRTRLDLLPPEEWREDPECPDKGNWPDWDYFQNKDYAR
ncbi:hypothetical protein K466DRAFT_618535 [Polyporus arcularius HHB13444]|uniref:Uncharacterized protein n=1 Tax=Polyporus arcularius HHB13444 TaxID=1314778 RepID=A0A5C3PUE3_9APHY|nr:hypothetical protein K466DRAFT_618535 [Polyporus arcularius HHB13444]